jgi:hypothetical protein
MNLPPGSSVPPDSNEEARQHAYEQLDSAVKALKKAKKILVRDWAQFTPGEHSAWSRVVKELAKKKQYNLWATLFSPSFLSVRECRFLLTAIKC